MNNIGIVLAALTGCACIAATALFLYWFLGWFITFSNMPVWAWVALAIAVVSRFIIKLITQLIKE